MKSIHFLLLPLLSLYQPAFGMPSSYSVDIRSSRGLDLDNKYLGRTFSRDLFGRDEDDPNPCTSDSCKKCDKCQPVRCKGGYRRDKADCKCKRCPPGTKPDRAKTACIPTKQPGNPENDKQPNQKKESKWEETKKRMKEIWDKKQQEKKDKQNKEGEEDKKDREKERMGKCLPLVSLSTGLPEDGFPQASNFFSEDYIDSEDIMKHWPSELKDVPDANIDTDEYMNEFLKAMDDLTWIPWGGGAKKRNAALSAREIPTTTEVAVRRQETGVAVYREKRFVKALFTAIRNFFARAGTFLGKKVNRLDALKKKGGLQIAEKGKGAKYADQKKAADDLAKDKNWKNCINGKKPEKNGPGS